jgi:hypothetical protein
VHSVTAHGVYTGMSRTVGSVAICFGVVLRLHIHGWAGFALVHLTSRFEATTMNDLPRRRISIHLIEE